MFQCLREYLKTRVFPWQKVFRIEDVVVLPCRNCYWLAGFSDGFLVFLEQSKGSGRKKTTAMSFLVNQNTRACNFSLP